ncbi:MAG: hypothetical protein M0C28_36935 [Candidatus Moduliflexus flocculans]|nr:hypothetical protein [Candidatus Moduliflexus flocculans]
MNYPVWELPAPGLLIAAVAIVHVFISHFAVGGGLFLVLAEREGPARAATTRLLGFVRGTEPRSSSCSRSCSARITGRRHLVHDRPRPARRPRAPLVTTFVWALGDRVDVLRDRDRGGDGLLLRLGPPRRARPTCGSAGSTSPRRGLSLVGDQRHPRLHAHLRATGWRPGASPTASSTRPTCRSVGAAHVRSRSAWPGLYALLRPRRS